MAITSRILTEARSLYSILFSIMRKAKIFFNKELIILTPQIISIGSASIHTRKICINE